MPRFLAQATCSLFAVKYRSTKRRALLHYSTSLSQLGQLQLRGDQPPCRPTQSCTSESALISTARSSIQSASSHSSVLKEAKKARKRATDRKSQQNHRRRQKAYIRELEDSVRAFERQSAADPNEPSVAIVQSYRKLQQRFEKAVSLLERMQGILNDNSTVYLRHDTPPVATDADETEQGCMPTTCCLHAHGSALDHLSCGMPPLDSLYPTTRSELAIEGTLSTTHDYGSINNEFNNGVNNELPGYPYIPFSSNQRMDPFSNDIAALRTVDRFNSDDPTLSATFIADPAASISLERWFGPKLHTCSPYHSPAEGVGAKILENMVIEAKAEYARGRFNLTKPSLRQLLTDGLGDVLAFRLFHYLSSYGEMPLHIFLGIFWVQYLTLRWHVLLTEEDYNRIPHFMRPVSVERQIPHSIIIDMFVWPDLRHALIRQSADIYAETVGMDLVRHLKPTWSASVIPGGGMQGPSNLVASIDIMQIIERQALLWEFWKIDPGFLCQHEQFGDCQMG